MSDADTVDMDKADEEASGLFHGFRIAGLVARCKTPNPRVDAAARNLMVGMWIWMYVRVCVCVCWCWDRVVL